VKQFDFNGTGVSGVQYWDNERGTKVTIQKFKLHVFENYSFSSCPSAVRLKGFLESSNGSTRTSVARSRCQMVLSVGACILRIPLLKVLPSPLHFNIE
jgi:hypothetical protein